MTDISFPLIPWLIQVLGGFTYVLAAVALMVYLWWCYKLVDKWLDAAVKDQSLRHFFRPILWRVFVGGILIVLVTASATFQPRISPNQKNPARSKYLGKTDNPKSPPVIKKVIPPHERLKPKQPKTRSDFDNTKRKFQKGNIK